MNENPQKYDVWLEFGSKILTLPELETRLGVECDRDISKSVGERRLRDEVWDESLWRQWIVKDGSGDITELLVRYLASESTRMACSRGIAAGEHGAIVLGVYPHRLQFRSVCWLNRSVVARCADLELAIECNWYPG